MGFLTAFLFLLPALSGLAKEAPQIRSAQETVDSTNTGEESFRRGQLAWKNGDIESTITAFQKAITENPDLFLSYYYLGLAFEKKLDYMNAADNFLRYLERKSDFADAIRRAGLSLARTETPARAIPYLEQAIAAKPNDVEARYFLAVTQMNSDRQSEAETHFGRIIQLDPELENPYYFLGVMAYQRQDHQFAKEQFETFLELRPDSPFAPDAHFMLGSIAIRDTESSEDPSIQADVVRSHIVTFLELKPDSPLAADAHYILGTLAAREGDTETARLEYETYLQLEPDSARAEDVRNFLAQLKEKESPPQEQ